MLRDIPMGIPFIGCGGCSEQLGRIAFPFTAFAGGGFLHTRDWRRYWLRMAAFALISEIPFPPGCVEYVGRGSSNVR